MPSYLTFDCYDTLVQYSAGKRACMAVLAKRQNADADVDAIIQAQAEAEHSLHLGPFKPLKEVLRLSLRQAFEAQGLAYSAGDGDALENAVRFATPFPETRGVLARLAAQFRLVIVSNSEDDIIADNIAAIGAPIYDAVTAAQVGAYKPDHRVFGFVLNKHGIQKEDVIHIAAGFYHDIEPGHALGWRRIWINRNAEPGNPDFGPYDELSDLRGLPGLLGL